MVPRHFLCSHGTLLDGLCHSELVKKPVAATYLCGNLISSNRDAKAMRLMRMRGTPVALPVFCGSLQLLLQVCMPWAPVSIKGHTPACQCV